MSELLDLLEEVWEVIKIKPWLMIWPLPLLSLVLGEDAPWWLRFDQEMSD